MPPNEHFEQVSAEVQAVGAMFIAINNLLNHIESSDPDDLLRHYANELKLKAKLCLEQHGHKELS